MNIQTVGVIGAGVIGTGLAHNVAENGLDVILVDIDENALKNAKTEIHKNLKYYKMFHKKKPINTAEIIQRIKFTSNYNILGEADFIVENASEEWQVKKFIYPKLDNICRGDVVFAVNTSCIPITKTAVLIHNPKRVIGMHFMNPVPLKDCVECIHGYHTSQETIAIAKKFLQKLGKHGIFVNDSPGFVTNRVLMLTINEAVYLVQEGTATPKDIDNLFRQCMGHKMGPLETADLIGLDTILNSIQVLYDCFNDNKYRPCPLLKKMVDAGVLGRKSKKGFYDY